MLKRPKLSKREDASSAPAASAGGGGSAPRPRSRVRAVRVSPPQHSQQPLAAATPLPVASALAAAAAVRQPTASPLSSGLRPHRRGASGNKSVASCRHTSYPLPGDLTGLPASAGTRTGPRTTSYRIPLQRSGQSNVYDTVN